MNHDTLVEAAEEAIDEVFSDTLVSQEETIQSLNGLMSFIETKIAAIKSDMNNGNGGKKKNRGRS